MTVAFQQFPSIMLHEKMDVVDDVAVALGSANGSRAAMRNFENLAYIYEAISAAETTDDFEDGWYSPTSDYPVMACWAGRRARRARQLVRG
ncbi:unnamed protein product [Phytophthora lilii]|uniref:Unnamed protein product n=1 Tax=Phytophthora lilii TaxID=2077276 RepID=A0A9W6TWN4_9STRA|nr:unnamed protein product [Phytophthora lilii]